MRKAFLSLVAVATATLLASGVALATFSDTPDPGTVGTNGRVWDVLRAGDKVYLAGIFTQIIQPDGTTVARNNLAAIDASTGQLTDWNPNVTNNNNNSTLQKMALSTDGSRLFVGGNFAKV